jgi:hypothetical protein
MFAGRDYERTLMMPCVPEKMVEVENAHEADETGSKQHFCSEWLPVLLIGGLIKRKVKGFKIWNAADFFIRCIATIGLVLRLSAY